MNFVRLVAAVLALCLFSSFIRHLFLLAWRIPMILLFGYGRESNAKVNLDEVNPLPILDMGQLPSYYCKLGRDSRGRQIFRSQYADGRIGYFYFDREASEALRLGKTKLGETTERQRPDGEARLTLGTKGFDANSSAWEVLGVARDASIKEIKAAYRRLITKFHPDRFQNLSAAEIADLERDTKIIHAAYAELAKS